MQQRYKNKMIQHDSTCQDNRKAKITTKFGTFGVAACCRGATDRTDITCSLTTSHYQVRTRPSQMFGVLQQGVGPKKCLLHFGMVPPDK